MTQSAAPNERRQSVPVRVGNVQVGGGAPIVVQSMTNTDTADVNATVGQVAALGARRLRDRAHHGRPRRGGRRRAAHQGEAAEDERGRAAGRRLPLHRPHAARQSSGLRRGARQVPHQSGQCRLRQEEGHAVLLHRRDGDQAQQAGAHRRELGLARSGAAHQADGREHRVGEPDGRARGDARGDGAVGADFRRARRRDRPAARQDHPVGEGLGRAGPDRGLSRARPPLELRDPPRPHRSRHGLEGHRRLERRARHPDAAGHRRHHPHFARRPSPAATARSR